MVTVTLSVPPELKKKMDALDFMNWSAVARKAFEEKIRDYEFLEQVTAKSMLTEEDAIELGRKVRHAVGARHAALDNTTSAT